MLLPPGQKVVVADVNGGWTTEKRESKYLQELYETEYKNPTPSAPSNITGPFNLNPRALVKNFITASKQVIKRAAPSKSGADCDDDLAVFDMATGVVYTRDNNGNLQRMENGKAIPVDLDKDIADDTRGCYTTGLGDGKDCTVVWQCLLSGKPENLARCLDNIKSIDMSKVAAREVEKMNPYIALQLLKTFGFKPRRDGLPPSFADWKASLGNTVDQATKTAILGNTKLMSYLSTVVGIIRNNPTIIQGTKATGNSWAQTTAGLKYFRAPEMPRDVNNLAVALQQSVLVTPAMTNLSTPLALGLGNGLINPRQVYPLMFGGGPSNCVNAKLLRDAFSVLYRQMERAGKQLVDEDKVRIDDTIRKVERLEDQLNKLMGEMKVFLKLHGALSTESDSAAETISINDLLDNNRISSPTGDILSTITNSTNQNLRNLTQLISELVNKVRPAMVRVLAGQPSAVLVPA